MHRNVPLNAEQTLAFHQITSCSVSLRHVSLCRLMFHVQIVSVLDADMLNGSKGEREGNFISNVVCVLPTEQSVHQHFRNVINKFKVKIGKCTISHGIGDKVLKGSN